MKSIVIFDEYNEIDLKPSALLEKYIRLTEKDVATFLVKGHSLKESVCPACGSDKIASTFEKFDLRYVECSRCGTLYISPRPADANLDCFYRQSSARAFWRDELSKMTSRKRKEKIIKPRFEWIVESTQEYLPEAEHYADLNTNQYGYIEEMAANKLFKRKTLVNPFLKLDGIDLASDIDLVHSPWWETEIKGEIDVISLFEVVDHTADVEALFKYINRVLGSGGLCFITAILISGFDLQVLWDKAENLYPPDRLNAFSVEGFRALFDRHDFEVLEFSTPGILDVEIVEKAVSQDHPAKIPKFLDYLLRSRDAETKRAFQEFLQAYLLSSYGRILIRKSIV